MGSKHYNQVMNNSTDYTDRTAQAFARLYGIIRTLRAPGGCPWDREQTPLTMRGDLLEEAYEAVDAINQNDPSHVREELGDVFLNTSMIGYMYEQQNQFLLADSLEEVSDKLIRRHPHVFPQSEGQEAAIEGDAKTSEQVLNQWDAIKRGIEGRGTDKSVLDEVPEGFPPLQKAYKMHKKAAKQGFDWNTAEDVFDKLQEELGELKEAVAERDAFAAEHEAEISVAKESSPDGVVKFMEAKQSAVEDELGDVLACIVNIARHLGVNPVLAMERSNSKFYRRFSFVEQKAREAGKSLKECTLEEMDNWWCQAKEAEAD